MKATLTFILGFTVISANAQSSLEFKIAQPFADSIMILYKGTVIKWKAQGTGAAYDKNDQAIVLYQGQWKNNQPEGKGIFTKKDNSKYEGELKNGQANGKGYYLSGNGDKYDGEWFNGYMTGKGIFSRKDGIQYDGDWLNNKRTGKGRITWGDGQSYEGEWLNNKRQGKGKMTDKNGTYEGDWVNDKRTGQGKVTWNDGNKYEGDFSEDKRTGSGIYTKANGEINDGYWDDGKLLGARPKHTDAAPVKTPFTKEEKKDIERYKKYPNSTNSDEYKQRAGYTYVEHGYLDEGIPLVKQTFHNPPIWDLETRRLEDAIYSSHFPRAVVQKFNYNQTDNATRAELDSIYHYSPATYALARGLWPEQADVAISYFHKAALRGYAQAMLALAKIYQYADDAFSYARTHSKPTPKYAYLVDVERARYWYKEAAKNGNAEAKDIMEDWNRIDIGDDATEEGRTAYLAGNYAEAYKWWKAAALIKQNPQAYFNVGLLYYLGYVPGKNYRDYVTAEHWFESAGDLGYAKGYFWKAKIVWEVDGFGSTAMQYYQKAADMGEKGALAEKQKIQDYANAVVADRQKSAAEYNKAYNDWWQTTYGSNASYRENMDNMTREKQQAQDRQRDQERTEQRQRIEREESQKRISQMERDQQRSTDSYNKKYGRN